MSGRMLKPLLLLNCTFVLMLVTLGPRYGWTVMVIIGGVISAFNILALRSRTGNPRQ